ncbi:MAG TPA: TonB-dependent receptor [Bryobacteraceae bacterium]|nr:TonB-dependent receptor [Bryobacteraceae bacterium]
MKGTLFLAAVFAATPASAALTGTVRDATGAMVENATVELFNGSGTALAVLQTDREGRFRWHPSARGWVQIRVNGEHFESGEIVVLLENGDRHVPVTVKPRSIYTRIAVSATRGAAEEAVSSPHVAIVKDRADILERPGATIGNALEQGPGVLVQQSTSAQVSPFLRGLTGYHVLNLLDGIRFNNSAFRSGPNQYLAFLEPSQAQRVEALLGPTGVQYGSDSLGGTIHVTTRQPLFASGPHWETHGDFTIAGATADLSGASSGRLLLSNSSFSALLGASGRRHNDLRPGQGHDSRNVYRRFFGMPLDQVRELAGSRLQDTGFSQYGLEGKVSARVRASQLLTLNYQRGVQNGVRGYKDLLGGLGRLQSTFEPQGLNWFYGRYEKIATGVFDSFSGTFSVNSQSDGGRRQGLLYTDPITRDFARVTTYGYSGQATTHWSSRLLASFGGEIYDERISSDREIRNPATGALTRPRPLYPDQSGYQNFGLFAQSSFEMNRAWRANVGVRVTGVRFETEEQRAVGVPASTQWFRDATFHSSLRYQIGSVFGIHALVSRGFRAPNLNDLGALGLNDLGYEIPVAEALTAGALLSTDAGEGALSKGFRASPLAPESLMNYEFGFRITSGRLYLRAQFFDAELHDPIVRRTLLFSASNIPSQLAGLPVTALPQTAAQRVQGVAPVAAQFDPRALKAFVNDGRSRYYGLETMGRYAMTARLSLEANYSYIAGRDLDPNRNVRRLPPQMGFMTLRYVPSGRRPWLEISMAAAGAQRRLSGGDLDDERIGSSFRRADIAAFFRGSRAASLVDPTGLFRPTGETLSQIQNRVLPLGTLVQGVRILDDNSRAPLYLSTAGWAAASIRAGIPLGERWQAMAALENLLDRNYRVHGSGVDAPGITAYLSVRYRF